MVVYRLVAVAGLQSQPEEVTIAVPLLFWFDGMAPTIFSSLKGDERRSYPNVTG
jgi:hypothetical protein